MFYICLGTTPVFVASRNGHTEVVQYLVTRLTVEYIYYAFLNDIII